MTNTRNKYLLICPAYPPPFVGGSKVWTYNMVDNCPEGFDILTSQLKEGCNEVCSARHAIFRKRMIYDSNDRDPTHWDLLLSYLYIIGWFLKNVRRSRYDAVIAGAFDFANGFLFLIGKLLGVSVIGLGNAEEFTIPLYGKGFKKFLKRHWMKWTHKRAAGFVVVCNFCRDILSSIGVRRETIDIIPAIVNPNVCVPRLPHKERGYRVLSVGRLVERKGFHYLMHAVRLLKSEFPSIELTIVGDGPYKSVLLEKQKRHEMEGYCFLRGGVSDEELAKLYQESDLFVLAHVMLSNGDTEGCPAVFAEAGGNGLPVIGGIEGGADAVIVERETGYLVNSRDISQLADRMKRILSDPELARRMGEAGREKVLRDHNPKKAGVALLQSIHRRSHSHEAITVSA